MDTSEKIEIAKGATKFVVRRSVTFAVTTAVASLVPTETKIEKIGVIIGAAVIGSMVSDAASDHTGRKFDEALKAIEILKKTLQDAAQE